MSYNWILSVKACLCGPSRVAYPFTVPALLLSQSRLKLRTVINVHVENTFCVREKNLESLTTLVRISSLLGEALARTTNFPLSLEITGFKTMLTDNTPTVQPEVEHTAKH